MLPPGHISAGYLTAYALIKAAHPALDTHQQNLLLLTGAFMGFAPDLDFFYAFYKVKSLTIQKNNINHHDFFSHTPVVWLAAGLLIYFLASSAFFKYFGLLVWLGSWSHFLLDSLEGHGIRWLWPATNRYFAIFRKPKTAGIDEPKFLNFWTKFIQLYWEHLTFTFICETLIIITALIVYFK